LAMLVVCTAAAVWPVFTSAMEKLATPLPDIDLPLPMEQGSWSQLEEVQWDWKPDRRGADHEVVGFYREDERVVALYLQQHLRQKQGTELVDSRRLFRLDPKLWHIASQSDVEITMGSERERVTQTKLRGAGHNLLVWTWYRIGEHYTANAYEAKLLEIWGKLTFGRPDVARIVLAAEAGEERDTGKVLQSFLSAHLSEIEASLDRVLQANSP
jgi:EpsI family protein